MIRIVCKQLDGVLQANVGGPLVETCKTFDVSLPQLEAWLAKDDLPTSNYVARIVLGIEILTQ